MLLSELYENKEMTEDELLQASSHEINIFGQNTQGLPSVVWICEIEGYHHPVLTVSNIPYKMELQNNFIIRISERPKLLTPNSKSPDIDIKPIFDWIKLNYIVLKKYWKSHQTGKGSTIAHDKQIKSLSHLNEMTNFYEKDSGIQYIMFIGKGEKHSSSRIKVSNIRGKFKDSFVVSISQNPEILAGKSKIPEKELKKVYEWIKLNYDVLMEMSKIFDTNNFDKISELKTKIKSIIPQKNLIEPKDILEK